MLGFGLHLSGEGLESRGNAGDGGARLIEVLSGAGELVEVRPEAAGADAHGVDRGGLGHEAGQVVLVQAAGGEDPHLGETSLVKQVAGFEGQQCEIAAVEADPGLVLQAEPANDFDGMTDAGGCRRCRPGTWSAPEGPGRRR